MGSGISQAAVAEYDELRKGGMTHDDTIKALQDKYSGKIFILQPNQICSVAISQYR